MGLIFFYVLQYIKSSSVSDNSDCSLVSLKKEREKLCKPCN